MPPLQEQRYTGGVAPVASTKSACFQRRVFRRQGKHFLKWGMRLEYYTQREQVNPWDFQWIHLLSLRANKLRANKSLSFKL